MTQDISMYLFFRMTYIRFKNEGTIKALKA